VSPYIHPRLVRVPPHTRDGLAEKADAEIRAEIDARDRRMSAMKNARP